MDTKPSSSTWVLGWKHVAGAVILTAALCALAFNLYLRHQARTKSSSVATTTASPTSDTRAIQASSSPVPTPTATPTPPPVALKASVVRSYYSAINSKDYSSAYSLLSDKFKAMQSFHEFQARYMKQGEVRVLDLQDVPRTTSVYVMLSSQESLPTGTFVYGLHGTITLASSDSGHTWLIDQRKIERTISDTPPPYRADLQPASSPDAQAAPPRTYSAGSSGNSSTCETETIDHVSDDGSYVIMNEGTVYHVDAGDEATASIWLPADDVTVCDEGGSYKLIDGGETVGASRAR